MNDSVVRKAADYPGQRALQTKGGVVVTEVPTDGLISTSGRDGGREDEAECWDASHIRTLHSEQTKRSING